MRHLLPSILTLCNVVLWSSCDDNTSSMGIYPISEEINNSTGIFQLSTRSLKMDSVIANSTVSYLGKVTDPETGTDISAEFAAQFQTFENYAFPRKELMVGTVDGKEQRGVVQCDSIEVRLYFKEYYGDKNNPMKLEVYLLDGTKVLSEDSTYYADTNLSEYIAADQTQPVASRVFTPNDYNQSISILSSSTYTHNVRILLNKEVGQHILDKYYEDPTNFADSYSFIRKVFPGLYFKTTGGKGTMLSVYVGTCNLFFRYSNQAGNETYTGMARFSATPEVIQSTQFTNGDMSSLLSDTTFTYLKTPGGICTEMTLPVDEIFGGEHATDSVSLASVTLTRYNKEQDNYQLGTPSELLMVRKQDYKRFFKNNQVTNNRTSFSTKFSSVYNTYTFSNISRLLSYCKHEKTAKAKAAGLSEEAWAAQNPDWNKVLLIPITTSNVSTSTSSGTQSQQASANHDMSLTSARLVGGSIKIDMQVIYSKYNQ